MHAKQRPEPQRLAYQMNEAVRVSGLSRTTLYELMKRGELKTVLVAGRRLVPADNLKALLRGDAANYVAAPRPVDRQP